MYDSALTKWDNPTRLSDFANPFATYANRIYPRSVFDVFKWSEWLWLRHGTYTQAIKKSVRYFLNDIELFGDDVSRDVRKKYQEFLLDKFDMLNLLGAIGDDYVSSGNSFTSVHVPMRRDIVCPECGLSRPLNTLKKEKDWKFTNYEFEGQCPGCGKNVKFKRVDTRKPKDEEPLKIIRWSPQFISIDYCTITGDCDYYYQIPPKDQERIKQGDPIFLCNVPWEFVEACRSGTPLKLNKETFYHAKCTTSASMEPRLRGWGLPLFMANFSQVVMLQILERYNEAIAMDYIVPFRLISPPSTVGGTDPMLGHNVGGFLTSVRQMLKEHQLDPTTWHTVPYPVQYQAVGGEGNQIVPVDLLNYALDQLLTSMGIPQEFYRTTLAISGPPIGLRMFEKTWSHHVSALTKWLNWFLGQCSKFMVWEKVYGKLVPTSIVEDETGRQVKLNLASANVISKYTALKAFGIDSDEEMDRIIEENRAQQNKMMEEQQKDSKMQGNAQSLQQGMMPPQAYNQSNGLGFMPQGGDQGGGGAPPAPPVDMAAQQGGGSPSLDDLMAQANEMAQQLVSADPTTRRRELTNLKKQNPSLHAQVKQMITNIEQQGAAQGIQQVRQGGGGQPPQ